VPQQRPIEPIEVLRSLLAIDLFDLLGHSLHREYLPADCVDLLSKPLLLLLDLTHPVCELEILSTQLTHLFAQPPHLSLEGGQVATLLLVRHRHRTDIGSLLPDLCRLLYRQTLVSLKKGVDILKEVISAELHSQLLQLLQLTFPSFVFLDRAFDEVKIVLRQSKLALHGSLSDLECLDCLLEALRSFLWFLHLCVALSQIEHGQRIVRLQLQS
jgi:hypothetical protein